MSSLRDNRPKYYRCEDCGDIFRAYRGKSKCLSKEEAVAVELAGYVSDIPGQCPRCFESIRKQIQFDVDMQIRRLGWR